MTSPSPVPQYLPGWSREAFAMAAQAKVLSGNKLEQLVIRLQRHSGRTKEACWRFVIQHGLKGKIDYRRWSDSELELLREELVKYSVKEVAQRLNRSPEAIRSVLKRNRLKVREIRCDLFSIESLAAALHIQKKEIRFWIEQNWLPASVEKRNDKRYYVITADGLMHLYKRHHRDILKRGIPNQSLFEAYVQYCYSPKHTVGEQLLDVRRDKRERKAFSAVQAEDSAPEGNLVEEDEGRYRVHL